MTQFLNTFIFPSVTVVKSKRVLNVCDISFALPVRNACNYRLRRLLTTIHFTVWLSPCSQCKLLYCQKLFTILFNLQCGFEQRVCMPAVCFL